MAFIEYNPNPQNKRAGDCVVRALSKALDQDWGQTYIELAVQGYLMADMPTANHVWGAYLFDKGFSQQVIPDMCPECYTVREFCEDYPIGTYVLATGSHVVIVIDSNWYDTWDSGDETPIYVWKREDK